MLLDIFRLVIISTHCTLQRIFPIRLHYKRHKQFQIIANNIMSEWNLQAV